MQIPSAALAALAVVLVLLPPAAAAPVSLFGTVEFRTPSLTALPQWQEALRAIEAEHPIYEACARQADECPSQSVLAWQAMIRDQLGRPKIDQLVAVTVS